MRIYDGDHSVRAILEDCQVTRRDSTVSNGRVVDGVDLDKLARRLDRIPIQQIRAKRARMNIFYEEVMVSADNQRGISFTTCLMTLAHYNVISDNKSLRYFSPRRTCAPLTFYRLEEFLRRRARLQRVKEAVNRNIVIGFFDTMFWSKEFRRQVAAKKAARMTQVPQFSVPEIFVDDQDEQTLKRVESPEAVDESRLSRGRSSSSSGVDPRAIPSIDTSVRNRRDSRTSSPTYSDRSPTLSPQLSPHSSYHNANQLFEDTTYRGASGPRSNPTSPTHSRQGSAAQGVMDSLEDSAWGESIRRSFTVRRAPRSHGGR